MMAVMGGDGVGDNGHDNVGDSDVCKVRVSLPRLPKKVPAKWARSPNKVSAGPCSLSGLLGRNRCRPVPWLLVAQVSLSL